MTDEEVIKIKKDLIDFGFDRGTADGKKSRNIFEKTHKLVQITVRFRKIPETDRWDAYIRYEVLPLTNVIDLVFSIELEKIIERCDKLRAIFNFLEG